jgi:hypothetical protein
MVFASAWLIVLFCTGFGQALATNLLSIVIHPKEMPRNAFAPELTSEDRMKWNPNGAQCNSW